MPQTYSTKILELNSRDKDFAGFKWLVKILDFEAVLNMSKVISIKEETAITTDGHRIHIYSFVEDFPTGIFKVLLKQKCHLILAHAEDIKFPEYSHVIPDHTKWKEFKTSGQPERDYAIIIRNMENDGLNYKYFSDIGTMDMNEMYIGPEKEGVMFEGYRKKALIMPMHL